MDYAFTTFGEERIVSLIRPQNLASRPVAERNGLAVEKQIHFLGVPHLVYAAKRNTPR